MALLEGKSPTEKKKIIAAGVLGLIALIALYLAFGRSSSTTASSKDGAKPKPTASSSSSSDKGDVVMPPVSQQNQVYESTPIVYDADNSYAPEPGRNIFAFHEPDPPCPTCPAPTPKPTEVKTPPPAPTPFILVNSASPQTVYAGSKGFRLEVTGDKFSPDTRLYFSQTELPTTFINEQKLVADIPANFIAQEGPKQIMAQTTDGKKYSNQVTMLVQAPPKPTVQYIGMIGRKRYNNDTAYFTESEKSTPFGLRLNDILSNRFRLIAITPADVTFQDVDLGFKHRVAITRQVPGAGGGPPGKGSPGDFGSVPFDSGGGNIAPGDIPGIPNNIQRFQPGQPGAPALAAPQKMPEKKDVDDKGNDDDN